jgi:hypothetical protein
MCWNSSIGQHLASMFAQSAPRRTAPAPGTFAAVQEIPAVTAARQSYSRTPRPLTAGRAARVETTAIDHSGAPMKSQLVIFSLFAALAAVSVPASAKGCAKGAAVGGVAGHVAGHHGVLGAAAGCAIGRHRAHKAAKQQQQQQNSAAATGTRS